MLEGFLRLWFGGLVFRSAKIQIYSDLGISHTGQASVSAREEGKGKENGVYAKTRRTRTRGRGQENPAFQT